MARSVPAAPVFAGPLGPALLGPIARPGKRPYQGRPLRVAVPLVLAAAVALGAAVIAFDQHRKTQLVRRARAARRSSSAAARGGA